MELFIKPHQHVNIAVHQNTGLMNLELSKREEPYQHKM